MFATGREPATRGKRDDQAAYEEVMRRHLDTLYPLVYAIIGNHMQTEDAVQECLVEAYMALPRFDEGQAFTSWIKGIVLALRETRQLMAEIDQIIPTWPIE